MEFIGRTLKKEFQGFGVFTGTIQSYDESSKYFEIVYEDGDSEELDFSEVVSLLENDKVKVSEEGLAHVKPSRGGRKPKKRRRMERKRGESGKSDETLGKVDLNDGFVDLNLNNGDLNLNDEVIGKFKEECGFENGNMIVDVEIKDGLGFDLNAGFNFKLNGGEGFNLNLNDEGLEENMGSVKKEREYIDLNLDVNGEMEESLEVVETRKKECGFDLNLGVDDEVEDDSDGDCVGKVKESVLLESVEELKEVRVTQDFSYGLVGGIRRETSMSVDDFTARDGCNGVQLKDESVIPAATEIDGCQGDMGSSRMQGTAHQQACDFSDLSSTAAGVSMMEELPVTLAAESSPSLLFDCIHVSILRMLRKHLEHLSNEGFESASSCLRSLNWNLLDLITWPVFMVEYFLIHDSVVKPSFDLTRLKLFKSDYYRQPVSVKVEMLRCLCDDMIEMEAIRMELSRRSSGAEPDLEFDRNINNEFGKKRRLAMDMSGGSCLTEEVIEDANDWNSDECCLCKMDGNLLCCDGCPAAYHSKCVGVASDLLPEGDWFCPECALDRHKPWMKPRRSLRGAELLGADPQGRLYFSSCGYLLV
ncbi:hypothetical protein Patl1_29477 [Pistacia atlantica]|uniref:Uncharacterized protein n=1 Tax=Pistacia atlantica TaxID=434234 RepID=A0ACC1AAW7_9ROSI|nr:hypothetical protein Patl1_29477 [Pistacia atlantica]